MRGRSTPSVCLASEETETRGSIASTFTIADLCSRYRDFTRSHYFRRDGSPTTEVRDIPLSLRELDSLFGPTPARDFSISRLNAVRDEMVSRSKLARKVVNQRIGRVKKLFKWAHERGFLPMEIFLSLQLLTGLQLGRTPAPEYDDVEPVPLELVSAILPHVSPIVRAMIGVQLLAGMRPDEATQIRAIYLDRDSFEGTWEYRPPRHKTAWRGKERVAAIGPGARLRRAPFLDRPPNHFLFSPAESVAWWRERRRAARQTKRTLSEKARRPLEAPKQKPGVCYTVGSYGKSIEYGGARAGVGRWTPNQLRHTAATEVEKVFGLEGAQAHLGHGDPKTTRIYAKGQQERAREIARERG